jgi:alpha/beta superfamily hydrolase
MACRLLVLTAFFALFPGLACATREADDMTLEQSVCGLKEPFVFWLWSSMAGTPNAYRLTGLHNVEDIAFETKDKRTLRGYKLKASGSAAPLSAAKGYLLVLQGNAILADQIIQEFAAFAAAGLDVYIYDYRGYGRSEGKRRLKAIISDYTEILAALDAADYREAYVYAMSFGGIAFLDGFEQHAALDRIVVDSTPSRLSGYGCPPAYDPVDHLPADCSRFMFIVGQSDGVVTPSMSHELVERAEQRQAVVLRQQQFGHPFMDRDPALHRQRLKVIEDYLMGR